MKVKSGEFDAARFSFHEDPLLVIEDFWTADEMEGFRRAMARQSWTALHEMKNVRETFANCGDWIKSDLGEAERTRFIDRTLLACVENYMRSFDDAAGHVMSFHYYAYAVGDCLSIHDDTDSGEPDDPTRGSIRRRIALTTYLHQRWEPDWGGELITYRRDPGGEPEILDCLTPKPGSLVMFTVPRLHRVCRVDPLAGNHRRLSIAGWFMTRH